MPDGPVIYEVRLEVDADIIDAYDAWLARHIEEMLGFEGFISAQVLHPEDDSPQQQEPAIASRRRKVRITQYHIASRADLDRYFELHANRMRQQGIDRFGQQFTASREIYSALPGAVPGKKQPLQTCQNCDYPLNGQYCANCGQRDKNQIISLWQLLRDLFGDLFEVDSRLWRTLRPLLFQPGRLTNEYLRGRRVHYTPPLRLYLVTSLVFFLVVFFGASSGIDHIEINGDEEATAVQQEVIEELAGSGVAAEQAEQEPRSPGAAESEGDETGADCLNIDGGEGPIADFLEQRARRACKRLTAEGGLRQFLSDLVDNVPGTMFIFLPAIALAMMMLYPFSRRYYVEHLLFFVHYHSFFYVILTAAVLLSRLPAAIPGQSLAADFFAVATSIYIPIYLFVAMRRVYRQSRALTAVKYAVLGFAYFFSLVITFGLVAAFTALSV